MSYKRVLISSIGSLVCVLALALSGVRAQGANDARQTNKRAPGRTSSFFPTAQSRSFRGRRATASRTDSPLPAYPQVSPFFAAPALYPTGGNGVSSVVPVDVNGDGKLDLVVANPCVSGSTCGYPAVAGDVAVLIGNGDGSFGPPTIYYADAGVRALAVADVNGDGKADLLVAGFSVADQSTVSVLFGNGDGTFQTAVSYASPAGSGAITAADLNGDGIVDLAVGGGNVGVLLGNGDGTFQPEVVYSSGGSGADSVVVADVNGDGKPDLIVANEFVASGTNDGGVGVLLGNGDGTFQPAVSYRSGGEITYAVAVADLNGDGKLDLVVTNNYASNNDPFDGSVGVLLGLGDGTFQPAVTYYQAGSDTGSAAIADVNHDGIPDLLVSGDTLAVLLGKGDGTFRPAVQYGAGTGAGGVAAVADVNGDGNPDVLMRTQFPGNGPAAVSVILGKGDGTFHAPVIYASNGYSNESTTAADIDGDGNQDLLVVYNCVTRTDCASGMVQALLGKGNGSFQLPVSYGSGGLYAYSVAVADLNNDGYPDLVVANRCLTADCTTGGVGVLLGKGDGTFKPAVSYSSAGQESYSVAVGDINGDGKPDLVVTNFCAVNSLNCTNGSVGVLLGNGDGTFRAAVPYYLSGVDTVTVTVADLNGDGNADVVVGSWYTAINSGPGMIEVLMARGDGSLQPPISYGFVGLGPAYVAARDVNGDGNPDLLVLAGCVAANNCTNGVLNVLLGNGDGTFQPPIATVTPTAFSDFSDGLAISDFNGDGKLDIASGVGNFLLLGNGDGTFQPPLLLGAEGVGIAAADFNGDGKSDLAVGGVAILMNITPGGKTATSTALVSSVQSSGYGQKVTFTATVTPQGTGAPTGAVTFTDGASNLGTVPLNNRSAALSASAFAAGTHSIKASDSGDSNFIASASSTLSLIVNPATTTTTVASSANPSYLSQTVTFTATVGSQYGAASTGSVTFKQGTTNLATVALVNGQAAYSTAYAATGARYITAVYSGDSNNQAGTSPALKQVVNTLPAATTTGLANSSTPSFINQPVTFTATVTSTYGGIPDGELVTFNDGSTTLASVPLTAGIAAYTTSSLKAGSHTIKATYAGDVIFKSSTKSITQVVSLYPSSISVTSSLNPSTYGQSVTMKATVTSSAPSIPTGTVTFKNSAISLGTATLNASGVATLTKSNIPAGVDSITAVYNGNAETAKSTSAVLMQTVNHAVTDTTIASSANPSTVGQTVTFTSKVSSPTTIPSGTLIFMDGTIALATVKLTNGKASYSTAALGAGSHSITAVYNGTPNIDGSTSPPLTQTVN
jgi:hypothetical protein